MNAFRTLAIALIIATTTGHPAFAADAYVVDAAHTSAIFGISHLGFSYTYGRFNQLSGNYSLDLENPAGSQFQFSIDAASIDTNNQKRDDHLRSPDFFNVKQFPTITFQSTSVTAEKQGEDTVLNVAGDLTLHGVTRPVTLPLKLLKQGPGMGGETRSGFVCQTMLKRSDFGMTNMIPGVGDDVTVIISFEGVREGGPAPQ